MTEDILMCHSRIDTGVNATNQSRLNYILLLQFQAPGAVQAVYGVR